VVPASMANSHAGLVAYLALRGAAGVTAPLTLVVHEANANPAAANFYATVREVAARDYMRMRRPAS